MERGERAFALTISGVHGVDHLLKRVFPPLVPIWAVAFGFPLWKIGLLLGVRSFGSAVGQAPMGVLSDRYDRRLMLPGGIAVIGVGIAALAAVPSLGLFEVEATVAGYRVSAEFAAMLLAMAAAGFGSSAVHPAGYPLITRNVSAEHKGRVLGMWGSASKFGDGLAPAVVGVLLLGFGWRPILLVFAALAVGYAAVLFVTLGGFETRPAAADATADPADAPPLVDRRRYLYPFLAVFAYFVVVISAAGGVSLFLPEFVTSVYGYAFSLPGVSLTPESTASFYFSAVLLTGGVAQLGTGTLVDRYDDRLVLIGLLVAAAAGIAVLALVHLSPALLFAVLVWLGSTMFAMNPARDALVSDIAPADREGRTFGYIWTGALLAASAAPPVVGYVADRLGLRVAFALLAVAVLLSAVPIALLLSDRVYVRGPRDREASPATD